MARIKFLQEDFAGFRPDAVKPYTLRPDQIITPIEAVQTARQGVALANEVVGSGVAVADFLTKAGVIGREKTKEQLAEEVAKKKAEDVIKARETQKQTLLQKQQAEEEAVKQQQRQLGAPAPQSTQAAIDQRKEFLAKINVDLGVLQKPEQVSPETYNTLMTDIDAGVKAGVISQGEQEALRTKVNSLWTQATRAKEEAKAKFGEKRKPAEQIVQDYKEQIKLTEEELKLNPTSVELQERLAREKGALAGVEKELGGIPTEEAIAKTAFTQFASELKKQLPSGVATQIENIVQALPQDRASTLFAELINKGEGNLTTQEAVILDELRKKYPQFTLQAGMEPQRAPAPAEPTAPQPTPAVPPATEARTPVRTGTPLETWKKETQGFIDSVNERKDAIAKDRVKTLQEKQTELAELDTLIETFEKYEKEVDKQSTAGRAYFNALNGLSKFFPNTNSVSKADLLRARQGLNELVNALGDPANLNAFADREDVRNELLNTSMSRVFDAIAEQQSLNQARVDQGGKLTPEQARRYVQLQNFISDTRSSVEEFKKVAQGRSGEENARFRDFAVQLDRAVRQPGNLPPPETEADKETRFQNALAMFDEGTKQQITEVSEQAKQEYRNTHYDANELMMMAATAALTNDTQLTQRVLGILKTGNVIGVPAQQFSDIMSGNHKNRYAQAVVETLFTRARGKSDDELKIMLLNSLSRQQASEGAAALRDKRIEFLEQQIGEKKEQRPEKLKKLQAEAAIKQEQASPEMLQAMREKALAIAEDLKAKALSAADYYPARVEFTKALRNYYANKIAGEIAKAQIGLRTEAIRNATSTGQSEIAAERNLAESERRSRNQQGLNDFDKFFDDKGKDVKVKGDGSVIDPITGQAYKGSDLNAVEFYIPTRPRSNSKEDKDAFDAFVKAQGAGNKEAGRQALTKRAQDAKLYSDRVANNKMDNGRRANFKYQYGSLITQDKADINRLNQLASRLKAGNADFEWMNFLDEQREELNNIRAELSGLFGSALTPEKKAEIDKRRNEIRDKVNKRAKELFKMKEPVLKATAPTIPLE